LQKKSDVVIVCVGLDTQIEAEGLDRVDLQLPGQQEAMIQAIHGTGTPTIVVLINAGALAINWSKDNVEAILEAGYGGEYAGTAIADVLFGHYNPAGRLPTTWPKSVHDLPNYVSYDMQGRTYRYFTGEPLYPFGYGLSYSSFQYDHLQIGNNVIKPCEYLEIQLQVLNTGKISGDEVIQIYLSHLNASVPVPNLQLSGVTRILLDQGQMKNISFTLEPSQMTVISEYDFQEVIEPGFFILYAGGQQPNQKTKVPSNVLSTKFQIIGNETPLSQCSKRK